MDSCDLGRHLTAGGDRLAGERDWGAVRDLGDR